MTASSELRGLAEASLDLLKAAIFDGRFPALFSPEVYGSVIGMFELNNLGKILRIFIIWKSKHLYFQSPGHALAGRTTVTF